MSKPTVQTAVIQSKPEAQNRPKLPLKISSSVPVPVLASPHDVLVRILAAASNPTDHKMVTHFYMEGKATGCDFCGIVEEGGSSVTLPQGTRVCGTVYPYRHDETHPQNGAFSQLIVIDSRHLLQVPDSWSDLQAAALGGVGWNTIAMAFGDPDALNLEGRPSKPVSSATPIHVLVYGGATATGIIAIQVLKASGYSPIAVCSAASAESIMQYGAIGTADYASRNCAEQIRALANGLPIKHALDCITDQTSVATCYSALARTGARYACLEACPEEYRPRRSVKFKVVMAYEILGCDVDIGHATYTRLANPNLHAVGALWAKEMQGLLKQDLIKPQRFQEVGDRFEGLIKAVERLYSGEVSGTKLVVRIAKE